MDPSAILQSSDTLEGNMLELITDYGEEQVVCTFLEKLWGKEWSAFLDSIKLEDMIQKMKNLTESRIKEEEDKKKKKKKKMQRLVLLIRNMMAQLKKKKKKRKGSDAKTSDFLLPELHFLMDAYGKQEVKSSLWENFCQKIESKTLLRLSLPSLITNIQDQLKLICEKEITSTNYKLKESNDEMETIKPSTHEFLTPEMKKMETTTDHDQKKDWEKPLKLEKNEASTGIVTSGGIVWGMTHDHTEDHPQLMEFLMNFDDPELVILKEGLMLVEKSEKDGLEKAVKKFHEEKMKLTQLLDNAVEAITSEDDETSKRKQEKGQASTSFKASVKGIVREMTHDDQTADHPHLMAFLKFNYSYQLPTLMKKLMLVEKSRKDGLEKLVKEFHLEEMKLTQKVLDIALETITRTDAALKF